MNKSALILSALLATSTQPTIAATSATESEASSATTAATVNTATALLKITISDVKELTGKVRVAIFNSEATFQKDAYQYIDVPADAETVSFSIAELPLGEYAIMMYHDVDDNDKMKSNLVGMPTEPWGASLRGTSIFGPPKWKHTMFAHEAAGTAFTIALQ